MKKLLSKELKGNLDSRLPIPQLLCLGFNIINDAIATFLSFMKRLILNKKL